MSFENWLAALEKRHLADLTISEVTRALRALSSCYVERRDQLASGAALSGAGKRAAFALFYGPQHFLIAREIARALAIERVDRIIDLGCGTGAAGAAVALECDASVEGFDISPWAAGEANWTYSVLGVRGRARLIDLAKVRLQVRRGDLVFAAYAINEVPANTRQDLLRRVLAAREAGASLLVIEPIGRRVNQWWPEWAGAFAGREDDWRFRQPLPPLQRLLGKGAGLDVSELTARSLFVS